jgi:uncharacterized lipoprotein NlpE involved in copper resistance
MYKFRYVDDMDQKRRTRRRVLQTGGILTVFGLAGCNALEQGDGNEEDDEEDDGADDEEATDDGEPAEVAEDPMGVSDADIAYGETLAASITEDSGSGPEEGDLAEPLTFVGSSGDSVLVEMDSDPLDPYLIIEGPDGDIVGTDDDGGDGYDSQLYATLASDGEYTVWASTYEGDETGPFTLSLERTDSIDTTDSIAYGETVEGFIPEDGGPAPNGDTARPITFRGAAGQSVVVEMESDPLDPYLLLEGPGGDVVETDDDGGEGYDSRMQVTLGRTGQYTIWASTYEGDETGPFTLSLAEGDLISGSDSIVYGETLEGSITEDGGTDPDGDIARPVAFEGADGDTVTISMTSDPLDPYIVLEGPDGEVVDEDDDGGEGYDSELTVTLDDTGEYIIWATTWGGFDTGPFTLSLERGDGSGGDGLASRPRPR